ncbi:MAG: type II toxin-antitoxin system HipA family toxin YjjJ [Rhodoferax sp.]|nr:type II toxin-antitoxin system HipA family toxin YjjJ [Rhodoferax sp.]
MRQKIETARDVLPALLRRYPGVRAAQLAALAQVSPATMVRILKEAGSGVIRIGNTSSTRYFLRRPLRGMGDAIPVYAIDTQGAASQVGELHLTAPRGSLLDVAAMGWVVDKEFAQGVWSDGLPYPLQDMRPQGFLGRRFALAQADNLGVAINPREWSDDDVVHVLMRYGMDTSGNLILGDMALQRWLQSKADKAQAPTLLDDNTIAHGYAELATHASSRGAAGSSAAGEFPKFTAMRALDKAQTAHVIVKYTAANPSDTVQRWSDLLVCEHLALQALRSAGIPGARSRILQYDGRTYLEVERFDRHGLFGRSPLCSLETIEAALLPASSRDWCDAAMMLQAQGWIETQAVHQIQVVWAFGRLIGNSDMHRGNLSFVPTVPMQVSPVYDMLPMAFAPLQSGEIPGVTLTPELPTPAQRSAWNQASHAAQAFWQTAAEDMRISQNFRALCAENLKTLNRLI